MTTLDTLNQSAAIAARDGVERGIAVLEARLKVDIKLIHVDVQDYFRKQRTQDLAGLEQLKKLRGELNRRVFDAYKEENP